jgi:hypothetical protein
MCATVSTSREVPEVVSFVGFVIRAPLLQLESPRALRDGARHKVAEQISHDDEMIALENAINKTDDGVKPLN